VHDFIREGIVELNRTSPLDGHEEFPLIAGQIEYKTNAHLPYRVELCGPGGYRVEVLQQVEPGDAVTYGWAHRQWGDGGMLELPRSLVDAVMSMADTDRPYIRIYGYANRSMPQVGSDPTGLDPNAEAAVRQYAKSAGFTLLTHDRALFAQWQGQSNNTDTSPTQMMNMAAQATREWQRTRGLIRTVRRYW
jgi:hypothetical protein